MSEAKFTKGPWVADIRVGCCAVYAKDSRDEFEQGLHSDGDNIYYASFPNIAMKPERKSESVEHIANAHIIAAAPEMYAMLESLQLDVEGDMKRDQLLAKARGEHE